MKRWLVAGAPVAGALLLAALFNVLPGTPDGRYQFFSLVGKALAAFGAFLAARQFDRGDYLRRAWSLIGLCYVLLFANTLVLSMLLNSRGANEVPALEVVRGVVTVIANLSSIAGMVLVGRAWRVAGLDLQVKRSTIIISTVASFLIGVMIAGSSVWADLQVVFTGQAGALSSVASGLGDIVTLTMMAPILLTALALRGGTLAWPWALNAVTTFAWLVFDGFSLAADHYQLDQGTVLLALTALRFSACLFQLSAGVLQRLAMRTEA